MAYSNVGKYGSDAYFCLASKEDEAVLGGTLSPVTVRINYTVECVLEGEGAVIINDRSHKLRLGDIYVVFPGDKIRYYSSKEYPRRGIWCVIGGSSVGEAMRAAGVSSEQPFVSREHFGDFVKIMESMISLRGERDIGADYKRAALVFELLSVLTRGCHESGDERWLSRAISIMETRLSLPISVADLAAEVGFERSYFSVVFKEKTGRSPHEYLTKLRIAAACRELLAGMSVAEVAESVGLEPKNFSRIFKKHIGEPPLGYSRRNKK